MGTPDHLTEEEVASALALSKTMIGDLDWNEKPSNSAFLEATSLLFDDTGATVPGLTVELRVRAGIYPEDCRFDFSLFQVKGSRRMRAYQINVRPVNKPSHTEPNGEIWYGSHHHFGERAEIILDTGLGCDHHEKWFKLFLKNANIKFGGRYLPPTQVRLI
jgi:hypothetical protein